MSPRGDEVDRVGRRVLEQDLGEQRLAVVGHLSLDLLAFDREVSPGDRRRGMDLQLRPGELRRFQVALVLLDGLLARSR